MHGAPFDDSVDELMRTEVAALGDTFDDGTLRAVASAASYVLSGRCIRTSKIKHCSEIEPTYPDWTVAKPHWIRTRQRPWGCVPGMPPTSHDNLPQEDELSRFLRRVAEHAMNDLSNDVIRPDFDSRTAVPLGYGYRAYNLWYSRYPWSQWGMSYRVSLRKSGNHPEDDEGSLWDATVGFTYLSDGSGRLEVALEGSRIHEHHSSRTDEVEEDDSDGRVSRYVVTEVNLESDELDDAFAIALSDALARLIQCIAPVVDEHRFHYRAPDATVYELVVLRGTAESVGGRLIWSRSEGTCSYETSDPLVSEVLDRTMARGFVEVRESLIAERSIAEVLLHVGPTDRRFLAGLRDELAKYGNPSLGIREVTGG